MKATKRVLLTLALLPAAVLAEPAQTARIVTVEKDVANCIGPVSITHIDGEHRQLPTIGFEIEPGDHTLKGAGDWSGGVCHSARRHPRKALEIDPLAYTFEAGKVYYIGFDHSAYEPQEWALTVWKVKDEDGNVLVDLRSDADAE